MYIWQMKYIVWLLLLAAFLISGKLGIDLYQDVHDRKEKMEDYAEINMVNYELFNMQLWKDKALDIVKKKIREFEISDEMYSALRAQIELNIGSLHTTYIERGELMDVIINEVEDKVNPLMLNIIKTQVPPLMKDLNLRPQIPVMSAQIIRDVKENEPEILQFLQAEIMRLVLETDEAKFVDRRQVIYDKYNVSTVEEADTLLKGAVEKLDESNKNKIMQLIIALGILILIAVFAGRFLGFKSMVAALTAGSIILLVLGVSMPMIDIDARLNSFNFNLLEEPISFDEQVIYYQSKSIVEVTKTLWTGGSWDLKLVGVLVLMFSIVFPFFKLLLSGGYLFSDRIRNSTVAKGIIFHLGKWSMADVFVVAIFMAYIGFYGIISTQLNGISQNNGGFAVETINYSRLAPGAFFFTAYTILSICISILINRRDKGLKGAES